jgi:hypothetical protein
MAWSGTAMAASGPHCNGVFKGKTPNNPITKVADTKEAYAGQTVTFTVSFKSTGPSSNVVTDCYRVDGGSNSTLNALVTGLNKSQTTANTGPKGTLQNVTFSIVVPSGLSGHFLVDRAKATKGSVESRSDLVSVKIIDPPSAPCTSNCGGSTGCTSNCGGTTGGGTTTVQGKTIVHKKTTVKGATLAHTGPVSAKAAFLGSLMIMVGLVTRIRRPQTASPMVETADNSGSSYLARYDSYLRAALKR